VVTGPGIILLGLLSIFFFWIFLGGKGEVVLWGNFLIGLDQRYL
jgi:hypothetical protein